MAFGPFYVGGSGGGSSDQISYDSAESGLNASTIQEAIDLLVQSLASKAASSHTHAASAVTAGTFAGAVVAQNDTAYTTYKVRNAAILSAVPSSMTNGTVAFVYS